jgi:hypothetical protein
MTSPWTTTFWATGFDTTTDFFGQFARGLAAGLDVADQRQVDVAERIDLGQLGRQLGLLQHRDVERIERADAIVFGRAVGGRHRDDIVCRCAARKIVSDGTIDAAPDDQRRQQQEQQSHHFPLSHVDCARTSETVA